jgi:hypothetical protein
MPSFHLVGNLGAQWLKFDDNMDTLVFKIDGSYLKGLHTIFPIGHIIQIIKFRQSKFVALNKSSHLDC